MVRATTLLLMLSLRVSGCEKQAPCVSIVDGERLYGQHCASCHAANLKE